MCILVKLFFLLQHSDDIDDNSLDHGLHDTFTYTVKNLQSNTYYKLNVAAKNANGPLSFSNNPVVFRTKGIYLVAFHNLSYPP